MKKLTMAAVVAAQLSIAAQPALAADLTENSRQQMGAFAGFRMRVPLDGYAQQRRIRAGLAVAPSMHSRAMNGESRLTMGEGLELGIAGDESVRLSLGGTPVSQLVRGSTGPGGERAGVSTLGWIAIGVGAALVITAVAGALAVDHILDCERSSSDDCPDD